MLKGFMIMPDQIVWQLELLKVVRMWDPDELQLRTEMEVTSGIESLGRYFWIHLRGWGGWRGLGSVANVVAIYKQCSWKIQCQSNTLVRIWLIGGILLGLRKRELMAYKFTWLSETHYCARRQMSSKVHNLSGFSESVACKISIYLINAHYLLKITKN